MNSILKITFLFLVWISTYSAKGYRPNEITYRIDVEGTKGMMTIYFTPEATIDLLRQLTPDLNEKKIINTNLYLDQLTTYFKESIQIMSDDQLITYAFVEANLSGHETKLVLSLEELESRTSILKIKINSFTEIYKHIENEVHLHIDGHAKKYRLNETDREVVYKNDAFMERRAFKEGSMSYIYISFLLIFFLGTLVIFVIEKIRNKNI